MKHLFNILRFLIYIPLSLLLLILIYFVIGLYVSFIADMSTVFILVLLFLGGTLVVGIVGLVFGFISAFLSGINPYRKLGSWIIIPIAVVLGIISVYNIWSFLDMEYTKHVLIGLVSTGMIFYSSMVYCITVSTPLDKE